MQSHKMSPQGMKLGNLAGHGTTHTMAHRLTNLAELRVNMLNTQVH